MSIRLFIASAMCLCLLACEDPQPEIIPPEPIGGLNPEAVMYIAGREWFPATIGLVLQDQSAGQVYLSANSSFNKGYQKKFTLRIDDETISIPDNGHLNYWEVAFPITASVDYRQFRDESNRNSNHWRSHFYDRGGIRVDSTYVEDGVTYASGEFFANPGNGDLLPVVQEITGLFHNVRVFDNHIDQQDYFDRITEIELFED